MGPWTLKTRPQAREQGSARGGVRGRGSGRAGLQGASSKSGRSRQIKGPAVGREGSWTRLRFGAELMTHTDTRHVMR